MQDYAMGLEGEVLDRLERMRRQMERLIGQRSGYREIGSGGPATFPAINVGTSPERVDVYIFAPGVDRERLEISLQQNLLSISGERRSGIPTDVHTYRRERFDGTFRRLLTLPEDVDPDRVEATHRNGVIHLTVQRREESRPRRITLSQ